MKRNIFLGKIFGCFVAFIACITLMFATFGTVSAATIHSISSTNTNHKMSVKPNISPTNCGNGPGGWFEIDTDNGDYCYGGGGSRNVNIDNVYQIITGNNWGAMEVGNAGGIGGTCVHFTQNRKYTGYGYVFSISLYESTC